MELHNFLQYLTIRIDIHNEKCETTSATGFFARLNNEDVLITAKHVAEKHISANYTLDTKQMVKFLPKRLYVSLTGRQPPTQT